MKKTTRQRSSQHRPRRLFRVAAALGLVLSPCVWADGQLAVPDAGPADQAVPDAEQAAKAQPIPQADTALMAQREAHERELASAQRVREDIDRVLTRDGRIAAAGDRPGYTRLAALATRCEVLANSTSHADARRVLLSGRARILASLARLEPADDAGLRAGWLAQLRSVAGQIRALNTDDAQPAADYWLLLASLAEASGQPAAAGAPQNRAERLLAGYIRAYADTPAAAEFVADARLSLAMLLDQRGNQRDAAAQLAQIGELDEDSPRLAAVARLLERVERIGQRVELEAVTTSGLVWRAADHAGSAVLIHVYADAVEPSVRLITQIHDAIQGNALGGCSIVSLRVGEPSPRAVAPDAPDAPPPPGAPAWPVIPVELGPGSTLQRLGVEVLPTLLWLDHRGRLYSIGHTAAVLGEQPQAPPAPPGGPAPQDTTNGRTR